MRAIIANQTSIKFKDATPGQSILVLLGKLDKFKIQLEQLPWLNSVPNLLPVHLRDAVRGLMFANGKGGSTMPVWTVLRENIASACAVTAFFAELHCPGLPLQGFAQQ